MVLPEIVAPARLPLAPRPLPQELVSSWLLRVAGANFVPLGELLDGLALHYSRVVDENVDFALSDTTVRALSRFCRTSEKAIRRMTITARVPLQSHRLLLPFPRAIQEVDRLSRMRARYAFCRTCLFEQVIIHVRWEWALAFSLRCRVHRTVLLDVCPACAQCDPLPFSSDDRQARCRFCDADLREPPRDGGDHAAKTEIEQIEEAYLAAILGAAPNSAMVGKASQRQFRCFVEDMLHVLALAFGREAEFSDKPLTLTHRDRLRIVCQLILNAAPSSIDAERRQKRLQGIALWRAIFQAAGPVFEAMKPESIGLRWPAALRNRPAPGGPPPVATPCVLGTTTWSSN